MALRKKKFLVSASGEEICRGLVLPEAYVRDPNADITDIADADTDAIELIQTHMSMVFLRRDTVYKVKKNVDFGFADFSSVTKRMQACLAETQLNQRLAPNVYLGVVPIYKKGDVLRISTYDVWTDKRDKDVEYYSNEDLGELVDWAVKMRRLPNDNTCLHLLTTGRLDAALLEIVAARIAVFHTTARKNAAIDEFGKPALIKQNMDENFTQTASHVDAGLVDGFVYNRTKMLSERWFEGLVDVFEHRVQHKYISDTHGDLRLEHVYFVPKQANTPPVAGQPQPPMTAYELPAVISAATVDVVVLDCIEFNERFRFSDPLSDAAFFTMDLWRLGRGDLAEAFKTAYLEKSKQTSKANAELLRFYAAYRSVVRAKVSGFQALDPLIPDKARALARSKCHWLVAYSLLAPPSDRPCLVLVTGLPATGKSTVARGLVDADERWVWVRSDVVRKELAGVKATERTPEEAMGDVYSTAFTQKTYMECWAQTQEALQRGRRVLVDATFREHAFRRLFLEGTKKEGAVAGVVVCECNREIIKGRMAKRATETEQISDATWDVYEKVEKSWTSFDGGNGLYATTPDDVFHVNTDKPLDVALQRVHGFFRKLGVE
ncbi:Aste57867_24397 [Aphanomyces stellatus]|uniref:Aste57867_24397 protein n=1 Tax=Aphanomyces stellatus TaxID=120398 RepID=A0A485LQJ6_9STRA|nr:hypothetical protein As57867_024321 [Aphanomyces stellatus]VFU01037.1 Aste57867_24397 [Aphanomyces stellatus]